MLLFKKFDLCLGRIHSVTTHDGIKIKDLTGLPPKQASAQKKVLQISGIKTC